MRHRLSLFPRCRHRVSIPAMRHLQRFLLRKAPRGLRLPPPNPGLRELLQAVQPLAQGRRRQVRCRLQVGLSPVILSPVRPRLGSLCPRQARRPVYSSPQLFRHQAFPARSGAVCRASRPANRYHSLLQRRLRPLPAHLRKPHQARARRYLRPPEHLRRCNQLHLRRVRGWRQRRPLRRPFPHQYLLLRAWPLPEPPLCQQVGRRARQPRSADRHQVRLQRVGALERRLQTCRRGVFRRLGGPVQVPVRSHSRRHSPRPQTPVPPLHRLQIFRDLEPPVRAQHRQAAPSCQPGHKLRR
jgi:hypothetical protein